MTVPPMAPLKCFALASGFVMPESGGGHSPRCGSGATALRWLAGARRGLRRPLLNAALLRDGRRPIITVDADLVGALLSALCGSAFRWSRFGGRDRGSSPRAVVPRVGRVMQWFQTY